MAGMHQSIYLIKRRLEGSRTCIDLKSYYASVERGFNLLEAKLSVDIFRPEILPPALKRHWCRGERSLKLKQAMWQR